MMLRQGDVLLVQIGSVPKGAKRQAAQQQIVLAQGEATGHAHTIDGARAMAFLDEGGVMFLTVQELTEVRHQEHAPLQVAPGTYQVRRQREYTPVELRNVAD